MHSNTVPVASRTRSRTTVATTIDLSSSDDDEVVVYGETPPKPELGSKEEDGSGNRDSDNVKEADNTEDITRKRRKFGVDILIDQSPIPEVKTPAHRTRSHFPKSKKNLHFGTFSQPICLADDDDDDHEEQEQEKEEGQEHGKQDEDEEEDDDDDEDEALYDDEALYESEETEWEEEEDDDNSDDDDDDYSVEKGGRERYACMNNVADFEVKLAGKKQKRKRVDVASMLKHMMFGKGEVPVLESMEGEPGATVVTMDVPTRSPFNNEKHTPPEKSAEEEGLDAIWAEMERGINSHPVEEGQASNEFKCRGSKREKGSAFAFTRKKEDRDPKGLGGEFEDKFQDSVAQEKGKLSSKSSIEGRNSSVNLPFKFTFLTKEQPAEKSEHEKEIDMIWSEMELGLHVIQQDAASAAQGENNTNSDHDQSPVEDDANTPPLFRCQKGDHNLVLDEEIGLICKYCLHVALEIKYWVPPFVETWEKSDRKDYYYYGDNVDQSVFDELHDQTSWSDDHNLGSHKGTVWDMIPGVKKTMYPHQCEAFEFLWSNLAGGIFLDQLKEENAGNGCVISHAPGTGKTRLAIVFIQSYMKLYPTCSPMIIAPKSMLLTWEEEFKIWKVDFPFHNLNNSEYSGNENEAARNLINKFGRNASAQAAKWYCRVAKLYSWKLGKSILGISYKLFELLTRQGSRDKDLRKFLLEQPSLLVLDEGHTPRNKTTAVWKSVSEIETKRRIILSGTPFQNNFKELYTTLCLARPKFADWSPRNEPKGKWQYLVNSYAKVTDPSRKLKILKEIRDMIQPFVHVYKGTILQDSLPGLKQLVVILKPTQLQEELLQDIKKRIDNVLKLEYEESVAAFHPSLCQLAEDKEKIQKGRLDTKESAKTKFLMELIRISGIVNEKVLVFSQFIEPLKLLMSQLKQHFSWTEGREVLHMHGKQEAKLRQAWIHTFNDPKSKVRVMLASTKACYEGISLVGASRVVLLDVVWNPSVEKQAISRAFRLGQKKFVYTYHLITKGTTDEKKCCRQAVKDQLSELVFFHSEGGAQNSQLLSSAELEDKILEQIIEQEKFRDIIEKVAIKKPNLL